MRYARIIVSSIALLFILTPVSVLAATNPFTTGFTNAEKLGEDNGLFKGDLEGLITTLLYMVLSFVGLLAACGIVYGGFLYITAAADEDNAEKGKKIITWAIIGLIIIGFAAIITNVILTTLNNSTP